jgi:hypothetical protein
VLLLFSLPLPDPAVPAREGVIGGLAEGNGGSEAAQGKGGGGGMGGAGGLQGENGRIIGLVMGLRLDI